ncbi:hypothetical protein DPMN_164128 [Dreissena polymorpha]|uniref:Uncharacterized protein n=1 Tax=Dreissena polymorpha TaxID=45954 RepID=A0A9D4EVB0_DREPO|nr:hypothetical protein DPMN_164128 [Dreissena polymorpha]
MDSMFFSNSVCEVNSILLDSLFKKASTQRRCFNPPPFQCFSKTRYIEPNVNILEALSKAAFYFTCTTKRSLVFSEPEIRKYLSEQEFQFSLDSGILTERYCFSTPRQSQLSFLHETLQEFLAAYYIAKYPKDVISFITSRKRGKYFVLEMSQVIKYLGGLNCEVANQIISCLTHDDFLRDINNGISLYISTKRFMESQTLIDRYEGNLLQTKQYGEDFVLDRCYALYVLYQRMIIDCFSEAIFSGQRDLCLKCNHFIFSLLLDESEINVFMALLMENMSNVRSLVLDYASLAIQEILQILKMSKSCLERLQTTWSDDLCNDLHGLNIRQLVLHGQINELSVSEVLTSMSKLEYLDIVQSQLTQEVCFPVSLKTISLRYVTCSSAFIHMLLKQISSINHSIECGFDVCSVDSLEKHVFKDVCEMSNVTLWFRGCSKELYIILRYTSLYNLQLLTKDDVLHASGILPTLNKLQILQLWGHFIGHCDIQFPVSVQKVILFKCDCSTEWLCSLMVALSSIGHPIECQLDNLQLQPSCAFNTFHSEHEESEISNLMSCDMCHIELHFKYCSSWLFEMFRNTSIRTLWLGTADAASQASHILPSLCKLTTLHLLGSYMDRCNLCLPVSLKTLTFQEGSCSPEWLCSLMIELSSLGHAIQCQLFDLELQSTDTVKTSGSQLHAPEMLLNFMSCDMSNIELYVKTGSSELFEMFRDTNIRTLSLGSADATSNVSEILPTMRKIETLHLWGSYLDRLNLQLPVSLQTLTIQESYCSIEWFCGLTIALSSIGHPIIYKLFDLQLHSTDTVTIYSSKLQAPKIKTNLLTSDMSNIELHVKTGSSELFEKFRATSIRTLQLDTADAASHASQILPTLCKLETLHVCGSYMGRCELHLPVSLQTLTFQEGVCSTEWLCSLMIELSSLGHPIKCHLFDLELQLSTIVKTSSFQLQALEMISDLTSCDMFNIELHVKTGSSELFEMFRGTNIRTLSLGTADASSHVSQILPTFYKLREIRLCGYYMDRYDLQLPLSLQTLIFQEGYCSTEWLCGLMIALSSIGHPIKCHLYDLELQPRGALGKSITELQATEMTSNLMSCDMYNIELHVKTCSSYLFEVFRDTSVRLLTLDMDDAASLTSEILPTCTKL